MTAAMRAMSDKTLAAETDGYAELCSDLRHTLERHEARYHALLAERARRDAETRT